MTDFQRDMEMITQNVKVVNNGKLRFSFRYLNRIMQDSVKELELKQRTENVLMRNGIMTVGDLFKNLSFIKGKEFERWWRSYGKERKHYVYVLLL